MGCISSINTADGRYGRGAGRGDASETIDVDSERHDRVPGAGLPTLLESNFQRSAAEDPFETNSTTSSRPTTVSAIPTPSVVMSSFESLAHSSNRAEVDKDSVREFRSVGVPSLCGTIGGRSSHEDLESNFGSIGLDDSCGGLDALAYLQDMDLARLSDARLSDSALDAHSRGPGSQTSI
mmetsp:Transcript_103857/g.294222  ORF Transcript_103857/g.294222 Transcript_103857/m.294222 type:complete len:180 (-) Transcript_103857:79-618(-)|eukprot:CAMPEP_0179297936 /NCGR_PEP_ID=MMETSP0797-20121207/45726_1 /TAXON_ID=47934 /ORGANISM="Dinophysis acuminata, Strain DAEP01" /LENGTH=179 /DNA_ID=CAMNT_0021007291 /DNA_START=43 /DNA_END=582 /DNA_ORIENTATION=+